MHLRFLNLLGRGGYHRRIGLEPVKRGNLAGQGTERSYLNVTFLGDQFQTRIAVLELGMVGAQLVVMGNLCQHPGIRTGDSREAERPDHQPGHKDVGVLDGNGDLAKLSSFVASYEKDVETFTQYVYFRIKILVRNPARAVLSCSGSES